MIEMRVQNMNVAYRLGRINWKIIRAHKAGDDDGTARIVAKLQRRAGGATSTDAEEATPGSSTTPPVGQPPAAGRWEGAHVVTREDTGRRTLKWVESRDITRTRHRPSGVRPQTGRRMDVRLHRCATETLGHRTIVRRH